MWILPFHKNEMSLEDTVSLFEKHILWRAKVSSSKTWKRRLKHNSYLRSRISKAYKGCFDEKALSTSKTESVLAFSIGEWDAWLENSKLEYKVRSSKAPMKSWPTPKALEVDESVEQWATRRLRPSAKSMGPSLTVAVKIETKEWATPTTQDIEHPNMKLTEDGRRKAKKESGTSHSLNLADQTMVEDRSWATPTVVNIEKSVDVTIRQAKTIRKGRAAPSNLVDQVQEDLCFVYHILKRDSNIPDSQIKESLAWATPNARDFKGAEGRCKKDNRLKDLPSQTEGTWSSWDGDELPSAVQEAKTLKKKLNPRWVESLMGIPIGWTKPLIYREKTP